MSITRYPSRVAPVRRWIACARLNRGHTGLILATCLLQVSAANAQTPVDDAKLGVARVAIVRQTVDGGAQLIASASAFAVSSDVLATNYHAISPTLDGTAFVSIVGVTEALGPVRAEVIASDPMTDLALLRVQGVSFMPLKLTTRRISAVEDVYAVGFPGVVDKVLGRDADAIVKPSPPDIREGGISNYSDTAPTGYTVPTIAHSAQISGGNSGGPLIDTCGRVVGVNTWNDNEMQKYGFSVSSSVLLDMLAANGMPLQAENAPCTGQDLTPEQQKDNAPRPEGDSAPKPKVQQPATPPLPTVKKDNQVDGLSAGQIGAIVMFMIVIAGVLIFLPSNAAKNSTQTRTASNRGRGRRQGRR